MLKLKLVALLLLVASSIEGKSAAGGKDGENAAKGEQKSRGAKKAFRGPGTDAIRTSGKKPTFRGRADKPDGCAKHGAAVGKFMESTLGSAECCAQIVKSEVEFVVAAAAEVDAEAVKAVKPDEVAKKVCKNFGQQMKAAVQAKAQTRGSCKPDRVKPTRGEDDESEKAANRRRLTEDEDSGLTEAIASVIMTDASIVIPEEKIAKKSSDKGKRGTSQGKMLANAFGRHRSACAASKEACESFVEEQLAGVGEGGLGSESERKGKSKKNFCQGKGIEQLSRNKRLRLKSKVTCEKLLTDLEENGAPDSSLRPITVFESDLAEDNGSGESYFPCELVMDIDIPDSDSPSSEVAGTDARRRLAEELQTSLCEDSSALETFNSLSSVEYSTLSCGDAVDGLTDPDEAQPTIEGYSDDATGTGVYTTPTSGAESSRISFACVLVLLFTIQ